MSKKKESIPTTPFPLLPLRNGVLFPGALITLSVGRERSLVLARDLQEGDILGVAVQKDPELQDPDFLDLHTVGTWAKVHRVVQKSDHIRLVVEGLARFRLTGLAQKDPIWLAKGEAIEEQNTHSAKAESLAEVLRERIQDTLRKSRNRYEFSPELPTEPGILADATIAHLSLPTEEEIRFLFTLDVEERLQQALELFEEIQLRSELKRNIEREIQENMSKNQKETILREQLRAIKKELGEGEEDELSAFRQWLESTELPEETEKVARREFQTSGKPSKKQHGVQHHTDLLGVAFQASLGFSCRCRG